MDIGCTHTKQAINASLVTHPPFYCLASTEAEWDEEKRWRTDNMLTDLQAVFCSLNGELGLRPVFCLQTSFGVGS